MLVSILVPVYGVEKCVEACAESLFAQTYDDLEYIFVDDCSPDRSMALIEGVLSRHPGRRQQVTMLRFERNRGLGAARLAALRAAKGDFVVHVDSDDYLATDAVAQLVMRQQQTGADMVDGAYREVVGGRPTSVVLPFHGGREAYLKLLLAQNTLPHQIWARLIRRSLVMEEGILPIEGVNQAEDYCVVPRIVFFARRAWVDSVVSYYRMDQPGTFKDGISPRHVASLLRANQTVAAFFAGHDEHRTFAYAVKVGLLKVYVQAVRAGLRPSQLEQQLPAFAGSRMLRAARWLLRCPGGHRVVRLIYLVLKRGIRERCK